MAGYSIGVLQLQRIEIGVFPDGIVAFLLGLYVSIILIHSIIEHVLLVISQRSRLGIQGVQADLGLDLGVVIVWKTQPGIGEMKPVPFFIILDGHQLCHVSVGDVVHGLGITDELVAILHYHQFLAAHELFLVVEDLGTYSCIIPVGPLVGPAQDDRIIFRIIRIIALVEGVE